MRSARALAIALTLTAGVAAAGPRSAEIPELAPPPTGGALAVLTDGTVATGDARTGGRSGAIRVQGRLRRGAATLWVELGALAWRDQTRLVTASTLTGRTATNPILGVDAWTARRPVRAYARLAAMPSVAAAYRAPAGPQVAPDDTSPDQLAPSQQTRVTALPFDRPTTTYLKLAAGARWGWATGALQLEAGLDVIVPEAINGQHGPLTWLALGAATRVTGRVDAYGHALARLGRRWDLADRDAGVALGLGAIVALAPRDALTLGVDGRVDACRLDGWGAAAPTSRCLRVAVTYTHHLP
jgi:hypothetical protein